MEMSTLEALLSGPTAAPVATPIVVNAAPPAWRADPVTPAQVKFITMLRGKCALAGFTEIAERKCLPRKGPASDYIGELLMMLDTLTPAQAQPAQKPARKPRKPRKPRKAA